MRHALSALRIASCLIPPGWPAASFLPKMPTNRTSDLFNVMTVDVEDYFHVSGFEDVVRREDWGAFPSRVEMNTRRLLAILDDHSVKATFFVLGWVAEHFPHIVREIHAAGHEIGCHSYWHRLVYEQIPAEFREDTHCAKAILEDIIGAPVPGYRAPSYSIVRESLWALEVLAEAGFTYDSSIYPILRDRYGIPDAPRFPYRIALGNGHPELIAGSRQLAAGSLQGSGSSRQVAAGSEQMRAGSRQGAAGGKLLSTDCSLPAASCQLPASSSPAASSSVTQQLNSLTNTTDSRESIIEFPPSTVRLLGVNLPIAGGGYLRLFPEPFTHWAIRWINRREGMPAVCLIHPWELDPNQPRLRGGGLSTFRHYVNLHDTERRFRSLLQKHRFSPMRDLVATVSTQC